ncbi:cryptochrome/photolyase family protein [Psychromonas sp. GE-S-Ul-11]|uniref:cryptochrome/photolyase family protein n=1 Tax=Psychromonas sp. GE-S-Ul-11 TaxID=3241170 RepID=UPI00390C77D9
MKAKQLKLILGDQLNPLHSWFQQVDNDVVYIIAELQQEADYTKHHIKKITAFFAAMADFSDHLKKQDHQVCYLTLDETNEYQDLPDLLTALAKQYGCEAIHYQQPDEYRLRDQLHQMSKQITLPMFEEDTEHFLLPFEQLREHFTPKKHVRMETFYRFMRKRFDILMEAGKPQGGAWNYDANNRQSFSVSDLKKIPRPLIFDNPAKSYLTRIEAHKVKTIGESSEQVDYPINRQQSLQLLHYFCEHQLPNFGNFQDAMTVNSPYSWSLYHSRLSFSLNCKMINPMEVVQTALHAFTHSRGAITLPQIEGFVRQIIGWREYVRGMYWVNMPDYSSQNVLSASKDLPKYFWDGKTKMQCLKSAISQSLEHAYAHHIQRLMITGNFSLLAGIAPEQVDEWYLGIYIDAIEWVELPNTRSMALFADGGWIATKPYAASGNYVNKMSDYCKNCRYKVKEKVSADACPLNSLYWNFIDQHYDKFSKNPRMSFPVRNWDKIDNGQKIAIREKAANILANLNEL